MPINVRAQLIAFVVALGLGVAMLLQGSRCQRLTDGKAQLLLRVEHHGVPNPEQRHERSGCQERRGEDLDAVEAFQVEHAAHNDAMARASHARGALCRGDLASSGEEVR